MVNEDAVAFMMHIYGTCLWVCVKFKIYHVDSKMFFHLSKVYKYEAILLSLDHYLYNVQSASYSSYEYDIIIMMCDSLPKQYQYLVVGVLKMANLPKTREIR